MIYDLCRPNADRTTGEECNMAIFWGTLSLDPDTDNYLLSPPEGGFEQGKFPLKVTAELSLDALGFLSENQLPLQVSILGSLAEDAEVGPGEILEVDSIASHKDIAVRAFEIYASGGQSAFDNWLSAERQLLDAAKTFTGIG
jgi:hypothetical protein